MFCKVVRETFLKKILNHKKWNFGNLILEFVIRPIEN